MLERTGIGLIERLVLETMAQLGARPDRPFVKSAKIVDAVRARHGVHVGYGYWVMRALASDCLIPLRLVEGHGNFGSPDYSAASAHFTEGRLTPAGLMAVESDRGDLPRLPIGLINGDMYAGGAAPSFDPALVLDALTAAIERPELHDEDYAAVISRPTFPTGCSVVGELAALRAGERARLRSSARITAGRGPRASRLLITDLPLDVGPNEVIGAIRGKLPTSSRARPQPPGAHPEARDCRPRCE